MLLNTSVPADGSITTAKLGANLTVDLGLGSAGTPSLTFDADTGLFSGGDNQVNVSTSGVERAEFGASEVVFNDGGADYDFRVEGDTEANLLFVDAGNDRIGLGTSSPDNKFHVFAADSSGSSHASAQVTIENSAASALQFLAGTTSYSEIRFGDSGDNGAGSIIYNHSDNALTVGTNNGAEKVRIDSSGRLLVGTNSDTNAQFVVTAGAQVTGAAADANADRATLDYSGSSARLMGHNSSGGEIAFFTNASGSGVTQRMTIGSTGHVLIENDLYVDEIFSRTTTNGSTLILGARNAVGTESETCRARVDSGLLVGRTSQSFNNEGTMLWSTQGGAGASGAVYHERDAANTTVMWLHHMQSSTTGTFITFTRGNAEIGSINFNGGTVSYNPFLGSHWAALTDRSKPNLLPGTILETVNQLMEWKLAVFIVNGETKKMAWNGTENVGDTVTVTYEGSDYTATIQLEDDAEELNKHVCVKVNDTAGSSAVFGVFLGWDNTNADGTDEVNPIIGAWNDMNVAAVGNYFIRIASGQTVAIGDLIEADGSGCGVVQSDDIIRSKTVAKVTSTTAQKTYDDGSFLITCVLCCG